MDPTEERRHSKRQNDYINMLVFVADSEYGIPRRCPCGGRIIDEVCLKDDYDTLPGKRFFTCKNYEVSLIFHALIIVYGFRNRKFSDICLCYNQG